MEDADATPPVTNTFKDALRMSTLAAITGKPRQVPPAPKPGTDLERMAKQVEEKNAAALADDPYQVRIGGVLVDPYRIARAFGLDPTIAQAVKKLLRSGRKHKTAAEDVREAITTLERWEAMEREDMQ